MGQLQEKEKALHSAFTDAIGENNKFKDFLLKVQDATREINLLLLTQNSSEMLQYVV